MVEHCPDHSKLMQDVGEICGEVKTLVEGQKKIFEKLDSLTVTTAVQKTKIAPVLWAIAAVAGAFIIEYLKRLFK